MRREPPPDRATYPQPCLHPAARAVVTEPRSGSFRPTRTFKQQFEKIAHWPLTLQTETSVLNDWGEVFPCGVAFFPRSVRIGETHSSLGVCQHPALGWPMSLDIK